MKDYCKHVLFVGPHYQLRGGMASVLKVYSQNINEFNFLATYGKGNGFANAFYFSKALVVFFWRMLTSRQIKIVHIHTACRGSFTRKTIILLLSKIFGKKAILHIHGGEFKVYYKTAGSIKKHFILNTLKNADELAVLSDEWKIYFDELTGKHKSIVINNPVVVPNEAVKNTVSTPVNVLYLNHITEKKGIFDLIELFKINKEAYKGVFKLNIAGNGDGLDKMKNLIAEYGLEELVEYKGWVSGQAKEDLLQQCNVFVLPSYFEGLPMSILEAMAISKPIIATNVGGIPRTVKPGENGWLFSPTDIDAMQNIFNEIKNNPLVLEAYGKKSFEIVQDFSITRVVEKLNGLYEFLLEGETINHKAPLLEEVK
jgi:glycosyltransferase involved in cell wall biosynthesis